jgi:hypothetical protein
MTKEEKLAAIALEYHQQEQHICYSAEMGLTDFKGADWRALRVGCNENKGNQLRCAAFIMSTIHDYIANKLEGEGSFDILFCIKKHSGPERYEEVAKTMADIEERRAVIIKDAKVKVEKVWAEHENEEETH